jgi:HPt (histidine-containing phosphotransfer) domain-containing protein
MSSINLKVIQELRSIDPPSAREFLAEIVDLFVKEGRGHLDRLRESIAEKDVATAARAAHTLKGSAGNLGAEFLSRLCARMQDLSKAGDWAAAEALRPDLEREFEAARAELEIEKSKP